jgi:K+-transporting ATPase KdpF subunit
MTSSGASYANRPHDGAMHAVAFFLSLAAGAYLLYALLRPERF